MKKGEKLYGATLDCYEIITKIGDGGNSEVYSVKDDGNNTYALKLLVSGSREKSNRFFNELNFCRSTSHDNIIKVIDNGITDDKKQMFYVMPLYPKTLREFIKENHSSKENIDIFFEIANGVIFFHSKGIIHRDLKPENILISNNSNAVITDFGMAHFSEEYLYESVKTESKMCNNLYAAPEQRVKGEIVTNKADIFALGLILNEMFTKKVISGTKYKKISEVNKDLSFLDSIVDKMISQNPNERFISVDEVLLAINASIEINKRNAEIQNLKKSKIEISVDDDLQNNLPSLVDYRYDDKTGKFYLILSNNVNKLWVECMFKSSYSCLFGYDKNKFSFENNEFIVSVPLSEVGCLKDIVRYFKEWINNANKNYPIELKSKRINEQLEKERIKKENIEHQEKIEAALSEIVL